jgi:isoleucyl-tRNA synthetase
LGKQFSGKYKQQHSEEALQDYKKEDKSIPYFVSASLLGKDLLGIKYEQLFKLRIAI